MNIRWPLITTFIIGVQMIMGGVVVGKDAGFVCPDWPLCHGTVVPPLSGLVVLELTHRATALLVTLLVLGIAIAIWRKQSDNRFLVRVATASVVSLLVQVVVGGLIVIWKLPGVTTTIDVVNSMLLLGLYVVLTMEIHRVSSVEAVNTHAANTVPPHLASAAWWVMVAVGTAIVVGAIFRHTGASEALFGVNTYLASHGQTTMPSLPVSKTALLVHILSGVFAAATVVWFLVQSIEAGRMRRRAWTLVLLVSFQMLLGMVSLGTELSFLPVTLHWTNAAVLVGIITWTAFSAHFSHREMAEEAPHSAVVLPKVGPVR